MKGKLSEQEQEFFLTGAKTCLDVMEALEEFRRQVQERCLETVKTRLKDLSVASQIEWDSKALRPYSSSAEAHFLGVRIMIESLASFCRKTHKSLFNQALGPIQVTGLRPERFF